MGFLISTNFRLDYPEDAYKAAKEMQRILRDPRIPVIYTVRNSETNERTNIMLSD